MARSPLFLHTEGKLGNEDQLRIEYVPLSKAVLWDRNPKAHDIGGICQSIREYGFRDPPAYDAALDAVVEGNGRIIALRMMHDQGGDPPRGIGTVGDTGEWAVPILFGVDASSKVAAEAYAVDHNNLTMLGGDFAVWDVARMWDDEYTAILKDLAEQGRSPVTVDGEDLDALLEGQERQRLAARKVAEAMENEVASARGFSDHRRFVRVLLFTQDVSAFEKALQATGVAARAEATAEIAKFYLEHHAAEG